MHQLNLENSRNYILGGKADFVLSDVNNSNHINFQVRQDVKSLNIYYVKFKSIDWIYIGYIKTKEIYEENVKYNIPQFFPVIKNVTDEMILKSSIFKKLIMYIYYIDRLPSNVEILYAGKCCMCGRKLTDPAYIEIGIGKLCLENWKLNTGQLE